jgi:cell wall assembly regulator SMI1
MSPATRDLPGILDELERVIRTEHPALHARFGAGLADDEIGRLAEGLRPYYLPAELVALYRWHDGWRAFMDGEYRPLLPDADFNSLAEAVAVRQGLREGLGSDGWHPLWFPAFGAQSGELVSLRLAPNQPAGQVFAFHTELDLSTSYDSVSTLFATTLECWRTGVLPRDDHTYLPLGLREIAARHNPLSRNADGGQRREISRFSTGDWPAPWKEVLGIAPMVPAADELVVTIAELAADPTSGRPIRGAVRGWGGSFDSWIVSVTDATGSVKVLATRQETENFRELAGTGRFELWLAPIVDGAHVDELADDMRRIAELPDVPYLAARIVPLRGAGNKATTSRRGSPARP